MSSVIKVEGLSVSFATPRGELKAVRDVSIELQEGESLGVVGESGSGKTVLSRSIMGLLPGTATRTGKISFQGQAISELPKDQVRELWGTGMAMVFQDPMTALNPVRRIGDQLTESLTVRLGMSKKDAKVRAIELLERVRIPDPKSMMRKFPYQLSGGMRQRIMIAIAVSCKPQMLFADEPTTALDVMVQAQILQLLENIKRERGLSMLFITHDLSVLSHTADRVAVMYAGRIIEVGAGDALLRNSLHPYSKALTASFPVIGDPSSRHQPRGLAGDPPDPNNLPSGCPFHPRCTVATEECQSVDVTLRHAADDEKRSVACVLVDKS